MQIEDSSGDTVTQGVTANLIFDPFIPHSGGTSSLPTPSEIVSEALEYQGSLWNSDNCTGLVWAVAEAVGAPFYDSSAQLIESGGQLFVPDPTSGFVIPRGAGSSGDWETFVTSNWQSVVQPGDLVRIPSSAVSGGHSFTVLSGGHSFIVVGQNSEEQWLVIDDTDPSHVSGNPGPIIVTSHTFDVDPTGFEKEVLDAKVAYVSRLYINVTGSALVIGPGQSGVNVLLGAGGELIVASGGTVNDLLLKAGGSAFVSSGGAVTGSIVFSGGDLTVLPGGYADPTVISRGGSETIEAAGTDYGAQISGGAQLVYGYASGATAFSGLQVIEAGGTANSTVVSGGTMVIASGGVATSTTIEKGGILIIEAGGTEIGLVNSGTIDAFGGVLSAGSNGPIINDGILDPGGGQLPVGECVIAAAIPTLALTANSIPSLVNYVGASNVALLGTYIASMFTAVEGDVGALQAEPQQRQAVLAHPHAG